MILNCLAIRRKSLIISLTIILSLFSYSVFAEGIEDDLDVFLTFSFTIDNKYDSYNVERREIRLTNSSTTLQGNRFKVQFNSKYPYNAFRVSEDINIDIDNLGGVGEGRFRLPHKEEDAGSNPAATTRQR